jgi:hypothetical protein
MALNKSDKEWITATLKSAILEAINPIASEQRTHRQTLYGINNDDGLVRTVEKLENTRDTSMRQMWKFVGIASGMWIGLLAVIAVATKFIFHLI